MKHIIFAILFASCVPVYAGCDLAWGYPADGEQYLVDNAGRFVFERETPYGSGTWAEIGEATPMERQKDCSASGIIAGVNHIRMLAEAGTIQSVPSDSIEFLFMGNMTINITLQ